MEQAKEVITMIVREKHRSYFITALEAIKIYESNLLYVLDNWI